METAGGAEDSRNRCSCGATWSRSWCCDCSEPLCDDCVSAHRRVTVTRSHRILNQPPGNVSVSATKFCRLHPSETLKLFCFTCGRHTCRDCQLTSHMNHRFQFVSEALDKTWNQLEDTSQPIRAQRETTAKTIRDISARLCDLVEGHAKIKTELENAHDNFVRLLKKRMDELMEEVEHAHRSETQRLQKQMQTLKQFQNTQSAVLKMIERSRDIKDLKELLTWQTRINSIASVLTDQDLDPPATMTQMEVKTNSASVQALLSFGFVDVTDVPFSVTQTSSCLSLPQTGTTSDSTPGQSESTMSHLPNPSSVALISAGPLCPQTTATCSSISPLSLSSPSASLHHSSTPLSLPSSWCSNHNRPLPPVTNASNTCTQPLKPPTSSKPHVATNQGQVIFTSVHAAVQPVVLSHNVPHCRSNTSPSYTRSNSHLSNHHKKMTNRNEKHLNSWQSSLDEIRVLVTSDGWSNTKKHPRPNITAAVPSGPVAITPETSSKKQHQSLLVKAVADLACDQVAQQQEPAENILTSAMSEDTKLAENSTTSTMTEEIKPENIPRFIVLEENTVPAENIWRWTPVSEDAKPAEKIRRSPVSEDSEPAENIQRSPVSEDSEPAENIWRSPVSEDTEPAEKIRRSPVSEDSEPAENIWRSPVSVDTEPAEDIPRLTASFKTESKASLFKLPLCLLHPEHPMLHISLPAENNQPLPKPAGELDALEIMGRTVREFVIGQSGSSVSPAPLTVSLFRLPLSLLRPGKPLFCFSPVPGDSEDKDDESDENPEFSGENLSEDCKDFTRPLSSPESPVSLHILSCSVCGLSYSSIICSSCGQGYHRDCHVPPVGPDLRTEWNCSLCQDLNDLADPYSSERRAKSPEGRGLSVLDQRRCETLLLHLLVESCHHLCQDSNVTSGLSMISKRLSLRRSPSYQTVAEFLLNIWTVFREAPSQVTQQIYTHRTTVSLTTCSRYFTGGCWKCSDLKATHQTLIIPTQRPSATSPN
uniref:E3 ubiquitin-protein ligase TRIM33 isoform X2 n=1 Tax=Solea senegalensis TaxID=28829 RepID=UPI001CD8FE22|nr:E3 ubiquitin-protein ligase TRIM33 isoform X2 [Solea senegalensis]